MNNTKHYSDCKNDIDFITQEEWSSDFLPEMKIKYFDFDPNKTPETICYKKEDIITLLNTPTNYVADWVQKNQDNPLTDEGYGGEPGDHIFFKTLLNKYIVNPLFLKQEVDAPVEYFFAIPFAKNYRVGNRQGTFGISQLHGQAPGVTLYYVMPVEPNMFSDDDTIKQYYTIIHYLYQEGEVYEDEENKAHVEQLEFGQDDDDTIPTMSGIPILITEYEYTETDKHLYIEFNEIPENTYTITIDLESYPEIIDYGLDKITVSIKNNNQNNLTISFMTEYQQMDIHQLSLLNFSMNRNTVLFNISSIENKLRYTTLNLENVDLINVYINEYTKHFNTINTVEPSKQFKLNLNAYFPNLETLSFINYKKINPNTISRLDKLKKLYLEYFENMLENNFPQEVLTLLDNNQEFVIYFATVHREDVNTVYSLSDKYKSRIRIDLME